MRGQAPGVAISQFSPAFIEAFNSAAVLFQASRFEDAAAAFRRLIAEHSGIAALHGNLGLCLRAAGRPDEAMDALKQALRLKPDYPDALNALGGILLDRRHIEHALIAFKELVKLKPDYPGALLTLGNLFMFIGGGERAHATYRLAVAVEPDVAVNHNNLGAVSLSLGHPQDAALNYRRALAIDVGKPEYRKNLGTCLLMAGDYPNGTVAYEGRLEQPVWRKRDMPGVLWQAQPLAGKTLLVHFEQGLGDSFQYIRYACMLKRMGARVLYECQPALKRVLSTAPDLDGLFAFGEPLPPYDYHISLMSLMHRLGTTPDSVPGGVPYLRAEPELEAGWAERLERLEGGKRPALRVGINWHGNETGKSIPLECFEAMGKLPGVRLYSLQKVSGLDHLERLRDRVAVTELGADFDAGPDAFLDTAAVMANLDLIITCDTSVCHLAGAMGRPTWVVLKWFADWRWMRDRLDSPWYPTMRLFRQATSNDWAEVMDRVTAEVAANAGGQATPNPAEGTLR
ncbi:tetratricopeptide repeat protein [Azospirillum sp. YIM B02556]|uniref:Tetratricopeptide repeat protein n=1 Tax=Azospirillum endophyticum TaxID=2800326 RepID=A0ABS1FBE4_9PROT|nr:tetratricopeptide repeat protein [Azospirillum endophyticum]MBK1840744.1 tetratricopeptide repeat protein [Azospirillum endophyticum]